MHTNLRVFDICTFVLVRFVFVFLLWDDNPLVHEIVVNHHIPILHSSKHINIVDFSFIRHRQAKFNQLHLVFKLVNNLHISNVVVDERLIVICIPITKRIVWITVFTFTQLDICDMVKTIRLLICVSKLSIQIKIIKSGNTLNVIDLMTTTHVDDIS